MRVPTFNVISFVIFLKTQFFAKKLVARLGNRIGAKLGQEIGATH
jgi:hypothetical protein